MGRAVEIKSGFPQLYILRINDMAHVLVVGGTDHLKEVSLFLAEHDNIVSVVARSESKLFELKSEAEKRNLKGSINPIPVDYSREDQLTNRIHQAVQEFGAIILAVNWTSGEELDHTYLLADLIHKKAPICRFFQVMGTENGAVTPDQKLSPTSSSHLPKVLFRRIILGVRRMENGLVSLLNSREASEGIINAIRNDIREAWIGINSPLGTTAKLA